MTTQPLLNSDRPPADDEIAAYLGQPYGGFWSALNYFIKETYGVEREAHSGGSGRGWTLRYRKGGRPLCETTPQPGALTVLVVLGAAEAARALDGLDTFGPTVCDCLINARAFHDGRWLWIKVESEREIEDIQRLLLIKRKPARQKTA